MHRQNIIEKTQNIKTVTIEDQVCYAGKNSNKITYYYSLQLNSIVKWATDELMCRKKVKDWPTFGYPLDYVFIAIYMVITYWPHCTFFFSFFAVLSTDFL